MLYQPHTSAGRVPTVQAYRVFAQRPWKHAALSPADQHGFAPNWSRGNLLRNYGARGTCAGRRVARIGNHVVPRSIAQDGGDHVKFCATAGLACNVLLIAPGGATRDKIMQVERRFTQPELDSTAEYVNHHYAGWQLEAIREDLLGKIAGERERYDAQLSAALTLCDPQLLAENPAQNMYVEGAAQMAGASNFSDQDQLRELLEAIEEKHKLVALLNHCIDSPEPVHVQIGLDEITSTGGNLALISAPYSVHEQTQGSLGVLGPARMQYERAITAVAFVARALSETMGKGGTS